MRLKNIVLLFSILSIIVLSGLIFESKVYAATILVEKESNDVLNLSIDDLEGLSVASFHIGLKFDSDIVNNVKFTFSSSLPSATSKEAKYDSNTNELNIYYIGVTELNNSNNNILVGTIDITRNSSKEDEDFEIDLVGASISSMKFDSLEDVKTNIPTITTDKNPSGGSSSGSHSSGGSSSSGFVSKKNFEELEVERYMVENDDLSGLAVSLRTVADDDRVNQNIYAVDEKVTYYIDYKNGGKDINGTVKIELELPLSFKSVESSGASVSTKDKTMTWKLSGLDRDESGTIEVVVRYTSLGSNSTTYKMVKPTVSIYDGSKKKDTSAVLNKIIKDVDEEVIDEHEPYMRGDAKGTFRPDDTISRAEAAIVLTRVFGINTNAYYTANFTDINDTYEEARKAIAAASAHGLIQGYPDKTYRPNQSMTRAEFMTILAREIETVYEDGFEVKDEEELIKMYKRKSTVYDLEEFADYGSSWANVYVTSLIRLNMTPVTEGSTNLRLNDAITRAEVTQLINYYLLRTPANVTSYTRSGFTDVTKSHKLFGDIVEATREAHYYEYTDDFEEIAR